MILKNNSIYIGLTALLTFAGTAWSGGYISAKASPPLLLNEAPDGRQVPVASEDELEKAFNNAKPGDRIVLQDGVYTGRFALSKSGKPSQPIVIRPRNKNGVTFNISKELYLDGEYAHVTGCHFTGHGVRIRGNHNRVSRNTFMKGENYAVRLRDTASYNRVDHNEITQWDGGGGISLGQVLEGMTGNHIDYNYIHDNLTVAYQEALHVGDREASFFNLDTVIEFNLLERVDSDEESEAISVKSSGNLIYANTWLNMTDRVLNIRHGRDNVVKNNTLLNMNIGTLGDATKVIGNHIINGDIMLKTGTCVEEDVPTGEGCFPVARNWYIAGNIVENGKIRVGTSSYPLKVPGTVLVCNQAEVSLENETGTRQLSECPDDIGEAIVVTRDMVGPEAPDPHSP